MPKNILIFSDGTGQVGGLRPDQRLSNVYKMYWAMRPGPDSPIRAAEQICYYDAGIGSDETGRFSYQRLKNLIASALGAGIDDNVIDCYEKIISYYEPGDRVILIGFSRGAYTARAVANVMNLCGVPTATPDGGLPPRGGARLRKIASDAVLYVYNHGNGYPRGQAPYFEQREELGRRFRQKYRSHVPDAETDVQGNAQPTFIGVFDTVAALGNKALGWALFGIGCLLCTMVWVAWNADWPWVFWLAPLAALLGVVALWVELLVSQFKYFSPDPERRLRFRNPRDWPMILKHGHFAFWNRANYDKWLDGEVRHARHAISIDERRKSFPRVRWATKTEFQKTAGRDPVWLKQVWFAGCHSDVGGSYPEPESRLSDIALDWMMDEMKECLPELQVNEAMLHRNLDPLGLQHEETYFFRFGPIRIKWPAEPRAIHKDAELHPSVLERLAADAAPQLGEMKPYRPEALRNHSRAKRYFEGGAGE